MEKKLELTDAQWRLVHRLNDLCREMRKEGIGLVLKGEDVYAMNVTEVFETFYPDEDYDNEMELQTAEIAYDDMALVGIVPFAVGGVLDETLGIAYKNDKQ